jgi:hypothetical protein
MLDFLFALGQFFCLLALLYGLFLVLAHGDCVDEMRQHYDPITGHDCLANHSRKDAVKVDRRRQSPQPL